MTSLSQTRSATLAELLIPARPSSRTQAARRGGRHPRFMERTQRLRLEWEVQRRSQEFLIVALVPRTARVLRPSAFLGPRGVLAVISIRTLLYQSTPWLGSRL